MSERPENPQDENLSSTGGWHSPAEASPWQAPETQTMPSVAWREVKALPENVDAKPQKRGGWHLPDEDDTVFTADDVVEITSEPRQQATSSIASARPEDLIADILGQSRSSTPRPEDFVYPTETTRDEEDETVAADTLEEGATLLVDEEDFAAEDVPDFDDDDEAISMSEYMALANLATISRILMRLTSHQLNGQFSILHVKLKTKWTQDVNLRLRMVIPSRWTTPAHNPLIRQKITPVNN